VERDTINKLLDMGHVPANMERRIILEIFNRSAEEFNDIMTEEGLANAKYGRNRIIAELQQQGHSISFTDFDERTAALLREHIFEASSRTLERMTGDVMEVLAQGYEGGLGIDDIADTLHGTFENMQDYETTRIARTEVNSMQNEGAEITEQELGVEFHQWWTGDDERVRDGPNADHVEMHGQIVRVGDYFSNGLERPGDKSGDISEWINCRCRLVPFIMPQGKRPPANRSYFYERDLEDAA